MALLVSDNPIVTTYPTYVVSKDHQSESIYEWLRQYSLVGIGTTINWGMESGFLSWRVYAKLTPELEVLFRLKFNVLEKRVKGYEKMRLDQFKQRWKKK